MSIVARDEPRRSQTRYMMLPRSSSLRSVVVSPQSISTATPVFPKVCLLGQLLAAAVGVALLGQLQCRRSGAM